MTRFATAPSLAEFGQAMLRKTSDDATSAEAAIWAMLHASLGGVDSQGIRLVPLVCPLPETGSH